MTGPEVWRRDDRPVLICACGHTQTEHGTDSTARATVLAQPCGRGGCGCRTWREAARRWTEQRTITETSGL